MSNIAVSVSVEQVILLSTAIAGGGQIRFRYGTCTFQACAIN